MRVLIYGVNSQNKGAQLLLAAASKRLTSMGHVPIVSARDVDKDARRNVGAVGMFSIERLGPVRSLGLDLLPRLQAAMLPVAGDAGFDYVLDASGFSLTDAWGMAPVRSRLSRLQRWTSRRTGFALLPQAFGPFTGDDIRYGVSRILGYADRVWARDPVSAEYLRPLCSSGTAVTVAPDITIAHGVGEPSTDASGAVVLVPNWNLAARSGDNGRRAYTTALGEIASSLIGRGHTVLGLSHEGQRDLELIAAVRDQVPGMELAVPSSGSEAKSILAGADLVVAGRYHALVSALSSGVPAIAHSWSHKYSSLMSDFEVADGLADPASAASTLTRVDALDLTAERARLLAVIPSVVAKVDALWSEVQLLLEAHETSLRG